MGARDVSSTSRGWIDSLSEEASFPASIIPLYNYSQHIFTRKIDFTWLRNLIGDEKDAQIIFYFIVVICPFFRSLLGANLAYNDAFVLMRLFFSFRHPFLRDLPKEFAYHIYYSRMVIFGYGEEEECIRQHLAFIKPIYEAMKRSKVPMTRPYLIDHHTGNQIFPYPFERPYIHEYRLRVLEVHTKE